MRKYISSSSPLEPGSGVQVESALSTELLPNRYQQQVLHTLEEEEIPGILTGAAVSRILKSP